KTMTLISTTYNGVQLDLVLSSNEKEKVWEKNPVHLTETEMKGLALDRDIIPILQGKDRSPTSLAGIREDQVVSPLLQSMKKEYTRTFLIYKKALETATIADQKRICELSAYWMKEDFWVFFPVLSFFNFNKMKFIEKGEYIREVQAHRYMWFIEVNAAETARRNRIKVQIEQAIPKVIELLEKMEEQTRRDQDHKHLCMNAWQLKKVYQTLFSGTSFVNEARLQQLLPSDEEMSKDLAVFKAETHLMSGGV
ncbi:MAG: hypothetical protein JSR46_07030, partial [Verrucomicrobia bacterium]|nr:hypothetical protein [Verrucomicrobiota bacterium]